VDVAPVRGLARVIDVEADLAVVDLERRVLLDQAEDGGSVGGAEPKATGGEPVGAVGVGGEDEAAGGGRPAAPRPGW
jgi:hypothetical protein